jgi:glycerophosphoryl diester phosphodiesterase/HEAT repeat protein
MKKPLLLLALLCFEISPLQAGIFQRGKVQLICHRTANRDMPENTLESLELAARMGCNVVEIDIRRTLDGQLVLNHDDFLERLTSGMGNVELTSYDELHLIDGGAWMGQRFTHMDIPRFEDALQVAREQGIGLYLDIKTKGIGPLVLASLQREGMLERVVFGGEWEDVPPLYPKANQDAVAYVDPGVTPGKVSALQGEGKFVVANFSDNPHEMDLPSMRAAVAAGVDAINVDYPRLGADAVGRSVEAKLAALAVTANTGPVKTRVTAIRELAHYPGFPTQKLFQRWLYDPDDQVSRASAVALVIARPATPVQSFIDALSAPEASTRKNAAWAIGMLAAPIPDALLHLLDDKNSDVLKEALLALSRCSGNVSANQLLPFLNSNVPVVRGAAALALAKHQPEVAAHAIPELLKREEQEAARDYAQYVLQGKPKLTQKEIDLIIESYREQMKLVQSLEFLASNDALHTFSAQAFRSAEDYTHVNSLVAGYQLWDRISTDPIPAIQALSSTDIEVANRAEWVLIKAGSSVLSDLRQQLPSADTALRARIIRILAWQGDSESIPLLQHLKISSPEDKTLRDWALQKIQLLSFQP